MFKKRLFFIILLVSISSVHGFECLTYEDCSPSVCIGSARICASGVCVNSACVINEDADVVQAPNVDKVFAISVRFLIFAAVVLIIALLFPMLKLHSKAKLVAGLFLGIMVILFGLYLFTGTSSISKSKFDSALSDKTIISMVDSNKMDVEERIFSSRYSGKEYRISDFKDEYVLTAMDAENDILAGYSKKEIEGTDVFLIEEPFYSQYAWEDEGIVYLLAGEREGIHELYMNILSNTSINYPVNENIKQGKPPIIWFTEPGSLTNSRKVSFSAYDNDSTIDLSSLRVEGASFLPEDCFMINNLLNCTFFPKMKPGKKAITVFVSDIEGNVASRKKEFMFDNVSWNLEPIYPTHGSYVNLPKLHFEIKDEHSGINLNSFSSKPSLELKEGCNIITGGYDCSFDWFSKSGENSFKLVGQDNAGNTKTAYFSFVFDDERPKIEITDTGFIVSDNVEIDVSSLMLDRRRYSLSTCRVIDDKYHCRYSIYVKEYSVLDKAGNRFMITDKKER